MRFQIVLPAIALLTGAAAAVPTAAMAQTPSMQAARARNARATDALRTRITTVRARVAEARRDGKVTHAHAARMDRQIAQVQTSMIRLDRQQGFVSAAELASYNRTLGQLDVALDGHGVSRSYGNDALVAEENASSFYRCENRPVMVNIPSMPLGQALERYSRATRCPVSITVDTMSESEVRQIPTTVIRGRFTPARALQRMMWNTPFRSVPIKGGFTIEAAPNLR